MENCIEKLLDEIHTYNITNPGFSEASERVQDYDDLCVALYDRVYGEGYLELHR